MDHIACNKLTNSNDSNTRINAHQCLFLRKLCNWPQLWWDSLYSYFEVKPNFCATSLVFTTWVPVNEPFQLRYPNHFNRFNGQKTKFRKNDNSLLVDLCVGMFNVQKIQNLSLWKITYVSPFNFIFIHMFGGLHCTVYLIQLCISFFLYVYWTVRWLN